MHGCMTKLIHTTQKTGRGKFQTIKSVKRVREASAVLGTRGASREALTYVHKGLADSHDGGAPGLRAAVPRRTQRRPLSVRAEL